MKIDNSSVDPGPAVSPAIEGYEIIEQLGHGGMSSVWKACQISLGRTVVIKVLSENLCHDPDDIKQFHFEARVAANLKHPGIVQVYDFGQAVTDGRYYFVMEYVSGYTVGSWCRRKGSLSEQDSVVIAHSVAAAFEYAWNEARIIHRDIKPDNIMVDGDGTIKMTDLGLAQAVYNIGTVRNDNEEAQVMGTPNYMSPEQVKGQKDIDCRSDIYSLGATLHHLLTGQLPFGNVDSSMIMDKQVDESLEYVQNINPAVSRATSNLISKMLAKNPEERYQTWSEVIDDIIRVENVLFSDETGSRAGGKSILMRGSGTLAAMFQDQATSKTIGWNNRPESVSATDASDDTRPCPFCAEPIRNNAVYCRYCRKPLEGEDESDARPTEKPAIRLKSKQNEQPPEPEEPIQKPVKPKRRFFARLGANLQVAMSLALLAFVVVYFYQKKVHSNDLLVPIREIIAAKIVPLFHQVRGEAISFLKDKIGGRTETTDIDEDIQISDEDIQVSEEDLLANDSDLMSAWNKTGNVSFEEEQAVAKTMNEEYNRLLKACQKACPKVGDYVNISLKDRMESIEGKITKIDEDGVIVKVETGDVTVPFTVMRDKNRLVYQPEERARLVQRLRMRRKQTY